jgi:hypothetical protein
MRLPAQRPVESTVPQRGFAMSRFTPPEENASASPQPGASGEPPLRNGNAQGPAGPEQGNATPTDPSQVDRAQEMANRIGSAVASFTLTWGWKLARAGAVIRESVEDVWAEAQSIRRGKH